MKALRPIVGALVAALSIAAASPALALANRVFVSARSGHDANFCDNINTPCQTFAGAVLQLNSGGEAIVLDSGGYGPVTITKSLTIEAPPGVLAFIHPPSGDAITVNAGSTDVITLRGLVLNGGSGSGIVADTVGTLHIENVVISGFSNGGITVNPSGGEMFVKDTIVRQSGHGIEILGGRASIEHCRLEGAQYEGLYVDGGDVTVRDSEAAGNHYGFWVSSFGAESSVLNLYQCVSTHNSADGFLAVKTGAGYVIARIAGSWVSGNLGVGLNTEGTPFGAPGGTLFMRDDDVRACTSDGVYVTSGGTANRAVIRDSSFHRNNNGVEAGSGSIVAVTGCVAAGNFHGFVVDTLGAADADLTLDRVQAVGNTRGLAAIATGGKAATLRFAGSVVTQNATGVFISGGTALGSSPGTSFIAGNGNDVNGTLGTAVTLN